jgi:hypothetical protein
MTLSAARVMVVWSSTSVVDVVAQAGDQLDDVLLGLLEHHHHHRWRAAEADQAVGILSRTHHLGDLVERHLAGSGQQRDRGKVVRVGALAYQAQQPLLLAETQRAAGGVTEVARHAVGHRDGAEAERGNPLRVEEHLQLGIAQADRVDPVDAGETLEITLDAPRLATQRLRCRIAGHHQRRRGVGVGGGDLLHEWVLGLVGQVAVGLSLDLAAQVGDPLVELTLGKVVEAHQDAGDALAAGARDKTNVGEPGQRLLERVGDQLLDILGRRAGQEGLDLDPVEIDRRVLLTWQQLVVHHAHHHHQHEGEVGQDVVAEQALVQGKGLSRRRAPRRRPRGRRGRRSPAACRERGRRPRGAPPGRRRAERSGRGRR